MERPKRILIVDDEPKVAFFLQLSLEELGGDYEVHRTDSAERALEEFSQCPYDLIVTDLRLPGIDGLELIDRLSTFHPTPRVILITAYGSDEIEREAYRRRAQYFAKPFSIDEFIQAVKRIFEAETPNAAIV